MKTVNDIRFATFLIRLLVFEAWPRVKYCMHTYIPLTRIGITPHGEVFFQ